MICPKLRQRKALLDMKNKEYIVPIETKLAYGIGDPGISLQLSAIIFFFLYFYTEVVNLSPVLVGIMMLVGGIPLAFFVLGFFALILFPLTKKRYKEISFALSKIRVANI